MKVCGFVGKLLLLASCSALKGCGFKASTKLINVGVNCVKWNGSIDIGRYYKVDPEKEFMLQEVTGDLSVDDELPSNLKWPLRVSRLVLNYNARATNNDFSQIKAEEIRIFGFEADELIIEEPSVFEWYYGSIKTITGITGTRLKHVVLGKDVHNTIQFDNVTRLESLVFNNRLYPTFPGLTHVNDVRGRHLTEDFDMNLQRVRKLDITTSDYSGSRSILLNNLETADDVIIASNKVKLFSAPKLTWGRLEIKHATELNLNENLRWEGTSFINSDDFCEKYFKPFTDRGLAFETNNRCQVDCKQPYTPMNLTSYMYCEEFKTIEINQKSVGSIPLYEVTTIAGDLIITNYNGIFSAPKLTEIAGSIRIINSINFSLSVPNLKKIQGSVTIQNSGSFSAPNLKKIKGDIRILDSGSFAARKLDEIQGSVTIHNSSLSASDLEEVWGSISIKDSNGCSFPELKQIKGNLEVTNSNISHEQAFYQLESVKSIDFHQQSNNLEFDSLKAIDTLRISNSSLISISGIDVPQLEELTIEDCPQMNNMSLLGLQKVKNVVISAAGAEDISQILCASFDVTNLVIKNFQYSQMHLPLLSAGQLTLKDNPNLEVLYLKATQLTTPINIINSPKLRVIIFEEVGITYKLQNGQFKVFSASRTNKLQSQGNPVIDLINKNIRVVTDSSA
ncbi:hypothetical protein DSO57_1026494 [Entomophthora muscae]|uniref:Uncharacterized protein n=1 Tax=Entomophthora muscae TaxID=34485 RepID=A0ACC2RGP1_9FUNG|nr:hypothetical protein DSO57_1026494 [Entomophthora muscae]